MNLPFYILLLWSLVLSMGAALSFVLIGVRGRDPEQKVLFLSMAVRFAWVATVLLILFWAFLFVTGGRLVV